MKKIIENAFNLKEGELLPVGLLILQSTFLGLFYGGYRIGGNTMFISVFSADLLPAAYITGGALGILMTILYTYLQKKIPFSRLSMFNLIVVTLVVIGVRFGLSAVKEKWMCFLMFILMDPTNVVVTIGFWGMAARMFTLRQGKRVFGTIGLGVIFGIILVSYVPPILPVITGRDFPVVGFFDLAIAGLFVGIAFQVYMIRRYDVSATAKQSANKRERMTYAGMIENRYIALIAFFFLLAITVTYFVDFSFLSAIKQQYPEERSLKNFLALFTGTTTVFTLIIKTAVYNRLIKTYGLKVALMILPVLLLIFISLATIAGTFLGYSPQSSGFIVFFLAISMSKLFEKSITDAIGSPASKLLYQSLPGIIRFDVQARIDGTVNRLSSLLAGLLLLAFGFIAFFEVLHYIYFTLLLVGLWAYVTRKLYLQYRESLQETLSGSKSANQEQESDAEVGELLKSDARSSNPAQAIVALEELAITDPLEYEYTLMKLLKGSDNTLKEYALKVVSKSVIADAYEEIKYISENDADPGIRKEATRVENRLSKILGRDYSLTKISKSINSVMPEKRQLVARTLGNLPQTDYLPYLMLLLRDSSLEVRFDALMASARIRRAELCQHIIDNLAVPRLQATVLSVIRHFGTTALFALEQKFNQADTSEEVRFFIVRLYGEICGEQSEKYLLRKLSYPNRQIISEVLRSLRRCGYRAGEDFQRLIFEAIHQLIGQLAWNMAAIHNFREKRSCEMLVEALLKENAMNSELMYLWLSTAYDPDSIDRVRENIESGSGEGAGYALELLDLFVDEQIKPELSTYLDDIPDVDKIRRLQDFYPVSEKNADDFIMGVINREATYITPWTKACAIHYYQGSASHFGLTAHLFNDQALIRQMAGIKVRGLDMSTYEMVARRLPRKVKNELEYLFYHVDTEPLYLIFNRIVFLKAIPVFASVPENTLARLAQDLVSASFASGVEILSKRNSDEAGLYFLVRGKVALVSGGRELAVYQAPSVVGTMQFLHNDDEETVLLTQSPIATLTLDWEKVIEHKANYQEIVRALYEVHKQEMHRAS